MVQIDPHLVAWIGGTISLLILVIVGLARTLWKREQKDKNTLAIGLAELKSTVVNKEDCKGCHEGFDLKLADGTDMFATISGQMKSMIEGFEYQLVIHMATTGAIAAICQSMNIGSKECDQVREFYEALHKGHIAKTAQKAGGKG